MRRLVAALLACTAFHAHAADVAWLPSWKADDKVAYDVERCRKSDSPTKPIDVCARDRLEILVLRADDKGSLQRWRSSALIDSLGNSGLPPEMLAVLGKASNLALDIEFDESAQPVRLVNAAEVRAMFNELMDAMFATPRDGKTLPPEMVTAGKAMMSRLTSTDKNLLTVVSKDASVLYAPLGGAFPVGETMRVKSSMPSPFGTGAIQTTMAVTASMAKPEGKELALQLEEDIDRATLLATMDEMLKPMIQASGRPEAAAEMKKVMASMTMRRLTSYHVSIDNSWAAQVRWEQIAQVQGQKRVDSISFKRVP